MNTRLDGPAMALRLAFGLMASLAGLDKFFNILADWPAYVSPVIANLLPFSPGAFMGTVGIVELAVGIAILKAAPAVGAYIASVWLLLVTGNLLMAGFIDIAVRDLVLAIAAFMLARLSEAQGPAAQVTSLRDVPAAL